MDSFEDFLATSVDDAFAFAARVIDARARLNCFLLELKNALPNLLRVNPEIEGTTDWAHLVAGLMIAREWDPNGFAGAAAPFLASKNIAVWTAAYRLLLEVSRLDQATFADISTYADQCDFNCDALVAQLRDRVADA